MLQLCGTPFHVINMIFKRELIFFINISNFGSGRKNLWSEYCIEIFFRVKYNELLVN